MKTPNETWTIEEYRAFVASGGRVKPAGPQKDKAAPVAQKPEKSRLAVQFESMWEAANGSPYVVEIKVCDDRQWKWDYFWPGEPPIALELQGGIYMPLGEKKGGHGMADRMKNDADKSNEAARQGVRLFKLCTGQVTPERVAMILSFIKQHRNP